MQFRCKICGSKKRPKFAFFYQGNFAELGIFECRSCGYQGFLQDFVELNPIIES